VGGRQGGTSDNVGLFSQNIGLFSLNVGLLPQNVRRQTRMRLLDCRKRATQSTLQCVSSERKLQVTLQIYKTNGERHVFRDTHRQSFARVVRPNKKTSKKQRMIRVQRHVFRDTHRQFFARVVRQKKKDPRKTESDTCSETYADTYTGTYTHTYTDTDTYTYTYTYIDTDTCTRLRA